MTSLDRDLKAYVLRALKAAEGNPLLDDELKASVRNAFPRVAFTAEQLNELAAGLQLAGLIDQVQDPVYGTMWHLTVKGTAAAQRL